MHIDAFFEYMLGKQHPYYLQVPPTHDPFPEEGRDGVPWKKIWPFVHWILSSSPSVVAGKLMTLRRSRKLSLTLLLASGRNLIPPYPSEMYYSRSQPTLPVLTLTIWAAS